MINKHEKLTDNPPTQRDANKIKTELHLNKSRYYLELLTTETIELLVVTEGRLLKIKMIKINLV